MKREEKKQKLFLQRQQEAEARRKVPPKPYVFTRKVRNPERLLKDIFEGNKVENYGPFSALAATLNQMPQDKKDLVKRLLLHLVDQGIDFAEHKIVYDVVFKIMNFSNDFIKDIEKWECKSHNVYRQIASLTRHLFAKYYVPAFMDKVWTGPMPVGENYQRWFIHIAQGQNIRTAVGLPAQLTKKEAHYFLQAPADFDPLQAIRYGQILNLGGNEPLVRQVLKTRIAVDFTPARNEFWMSVFRWLLKHPMLDTAQYAPLVDYIFNQKYVPSRLDGQGNMVCAQPNMSMKDRDPETLITQMELWHKQLGKEKGAKNLVWATSGIKGYHRKTNDSVFTIQEICTQKELITEGRTMKHCVASYAHSCNSGRISIWKFEVLSINGLDKRLTIEVDNTDKTIRQARGKYNELPTGSDIYHLRNWANDAKLGISRWIV